MGTQVLLLMTLFEAKAMPLQNDEGITAKKIMNPKVVYARATESLPTIATRIFRSGFSQLPVKDHDKIIGLITEGILANWLTATAIIDLGNTTLKQSGIKLLAPPPIISLDTPLSEIERHLRRSQVILVKDQSAKPVGTITKSDLLKVMLNLRVVKIWK